MSDFIWQEDAGLWIQLKRCRYTRKGILRQPLKMPIAPMDEFGWETTHGWTDYDTISQGQFSRSAGRQLRTLSLSTMAMDWIAPWSLTQVREAEQDAGLPGGDADLVDEDSWGDLYEIGPWGIARQLDRLVTQGTPIRLLVKNPNLPRADLDMIVTMRSATLKERAGEPDARYFDLSFTEYREPKVNRRDYGKHPLPAQVQINPNGVALEFRRSGKKLKRAQWHRIGSSARPATLRDLAEHFYGSSNKWRLIQKRNRGILKGFSGGDSLKDVYDKRKRKNQPLRLNIPKGSKGGKDG